jgi:hypothetical protein
MYKKVGTDFQVFCDHEARVLRVGTDTPLISGFLGWMREIAVFRSREEWYKSSYCQRITDEDVQDTIDWFWTDLQDSEKDPSIR